MADRWDLLQAAFRNEQALKLLEERAAEVSERLERGTEEHEALTIAQYHLSRAHALVKLAIPIEEWVKAHTRKASS